MIRLYARFVRPFGCQLAILNKEKACIAITMGRLEMYDRLPVGAIEHAINDLSPRNRPKHVRKWVLGLGWNLKDVQPFQLYKEL
jgi:hypothetical protein